jgi:hypothetical protein
MIKETLFYLICLVHVIIWIFIMLAFFNKKTAYINLFYIIPAIYILHILPFHILVSLKKIMYPETYENMNDTFLENSSFGLLNKYTELQKVLDKHCTFSPISPQGMIIFGAITSAYALRRNKCL